MKALADLTPFFTAGFFLIGFLALLLTGVGYMLDPIKDNQARIEKRIDNLELKVDQLLSHKNKHTQLK